MWRICTWGVVVWKYDGEKAEAPAEPPAAPTGQQGAKAGLPALSNDLLFELD